MRRRCSGGQGATGLPEERPSVRLRCLRRGFFASAWPRAAFGLSLAFASLLPIALCADVFWRISARGDAALRELGGSRLYVTDVQINGRPGTLAAYGFDASAASVSANLSRRLGLPPRADRGSLFLSSTDKGRVTRFLVLPAAGAESCVALAISQSAGDAAQSGRQPAAWPDGVPALAAAPLFTALCASTRTAFVTAESDATPEAAAEEAAAVLRQAGWTEAPPSTPAFRIFTSGRKTCLLLATRSGKTGRTTISVLQREGSAP